MIFSSANFILIFLPIAFFGYFTLNRMRLVHAGKAWLVAVSLYFYAYWNIAYLPLLIGSILFNYFLGTWVAPTTARRPWDLSRRGLLIGSITANLALLGYFKYANFFVENINAAFNAAYVMPDIILPLGISFFTFTQIAYLVDSYHGKAKEYNFINYALFVTFFPHLIAGPILHHREMMSQFESRWTWIIRYRHVLLGMLIFSVGLFKKVIIADTFALWANPGFDTSRTLDFFSAWSTSLSYTFPLYFDFSGYCDMAIGAALLFNIWLPINFNSPYKALNIQDFWHRWHMTLSRFLRDYVYIPLGGNRCSPVRVYVNLLATFVLGGLWHGASWMFIIWGALHGGAIVAHRAWSALNIRMPTVLAWLLTFNFVNIAWVFFRAKTMDDALRILQGMVDFNSALHLPLEAVPTRSLSWGGWMIDYPLAWLPAGLVGNMLPIIAILIAFSIIRQRNAFDIMNNGQLGLKKMAGALLLFIIAAHAMMISTSTVFLYYNF